MALFPLSLSRAWDGSQNPLDVLTPHEVKAAELFVSIAHGAKTRPGTLDRNQRASFGRLFREHFGFELTAQTKKALFKNPAWLAFVASLQEQVKETVLAKLEAGAHAAFEDYVWSRTAAKEAGDFKEVRLGAADYLDRVGATKKAPDQATPQVTIVLKSHTVSELLKPMPVIEVADAELLD